MTLEIICGNENITFGSGTLELARIEGLAAAEYSVSTRKSSALDGSVRRDTRIMPREIEMDFAFFGPEQDQTRHRLISFFNPKKEMTIVASTTVTKRKISAWVQGFNITQTTQGAPMLAQLKLVCPEPYFLDFSQSSQSGLSSIIYNTGDIETGMNIVLSASNGDVTGDILIKNLSTGKFFKYTGGIPRGGSVTISTENKNKYVTANGGANAISNMSKDSSFIKLTVGGNHISITAAQGQANLSAQISYNCKFLGV